MKTKVTGIAFAALNEKQAAAKPREAKPPKVKPEPNLCLCGCGGITSSFQKRFIAGHDARLKSEMLKAWREGRPINPCPATEKFGTEPVAFAEAIGWSRFLIELKSKPAKGKVDRSIEATLTSGKVVKGILRGPAEAKALYYENSEGEECIARPGKFTINLWEGEEEEAAA